MPFPSLTALTARNELIRLGEKIEPDQVRIEPRDERWLVHLPDGRLAWFAASEEGRARLILERRVLRLLQSHCTFCTPRILFEDETHDVDIRQAVKGIADPFGVVAMVCKNAEVAREIGVAIGTMLAEQHDHIRASDVVDWLPHKPSWPESREWILERLPVVVSDKNLISIADEVLLRADRIDVPIENRVLIHGDLGPHNISVDRQTWRVQGIFDYEGAAYGDRHHDFRYLLLDDEERVLSAAIEVYESIAQCPIDRERVYLYNAACALSYLAFRMGHAPEEQWCGRTLVEDLEWTKKAMERLKRA